MDKEDVKPYYDKNRGEVVYRTIPPGMQRADNVMSVKEEGQEYRITINDPALASAMTNAGNKSTGKALQVMASINRYLALVNTALVPDFVTSNFARDLQTAMANTLGEKDITFKEAKARAGAILKNVVTRAIPGVWQGQHGGKSEWADWYKEFAGEGGKIGFFGLTDVDQIQENLQKQLADMQPGNAQSVRRGIRAVGKFVMDANSAIENATRLSAYVALRKRGVSKPRAASVAKNLTVNFNRKGELGTGINSLYLFSNASIQGTARLASLMKYRRAQVIMAAVAMFSFAMAQLNRMLGGDDDDGKSKYDKIPSWIRNNNMILMRPGSDRYQKLFPLPYGYNVFWSLGQSIDAAVANPKNAGAAAASTAGTMLNSFNPLGNAPTLAQTITPTVLRPIVDLALNQNFFGGSIVPKQKYGPEKAPAYLESKTTTAPSKAISRTVNDLTGGSMYQPGAVSVAPDVLDYVTQAVTGGAGRTVAQVLGMAELLGGKKVEPRKIPIVRKFVGDITPQVDMQDFYDNVKRMEGIVAESKALRDSDPRAAVRLRQKHAIAINLAKKVNKMTKRLSELRDLQRNAEELGNAVLVEAIQRRIDWHAKRSNLRMEAAIENRIPTDAEIDIIGKEESQLLPEHQPELAR